MKAPRIKSQVHVFRRNFEVPELAGVDSKVIAKLVKLFEREHSGAARSRLAIVQLVQLAAIVVLILLTVLIIQFVESRLVMLVLILGLWGVVVLLIGEAGNRAMDRTQEDFRAFVRDYCPDGKPRFCIECDYDLRASSGPSCPECGAAVPRVMS